MGTASKNILYQIPSSLFFHAWMFSNLSIRKHWASYLCTQKCVSSLSFSSQRADWIFSALTVTRNLYRIVNLLDWDQAPSLTFWPRIDPSCARVRDEARRHFFPFLWSKFEEKCSWPPKSWPTKYVPGVFFPQCSWWWESRGVVSKYKREMNSTNVNGILQWSFKDCVSRDHCEKPSNFVTCGTSHTAVKREHLLREVTGQCPQPWNLGEDGFFLLLLFV